MSAWPAAADAPESTRSGDGLAAGFAESAGDLRTDLAERVAAAALSRACAKRFGNERRRWSSSARVEGPVEGVGRRLRVSTCSGLERAQASRRMPVTCQHTFEPGFPPAITNESFFTA